MPNQFAAQAPLFHALGDPTRLAIVQCLSRRPETVSALAAPHDMALPSFMQHLRVLEKSGWIRSTKTGRVRTCELNPEALALTGGWLERQRNLWERRLDQLDDYLLKMKQEEEK